jgi:hypothetical protein
MTIRLKYANHHVMMMTVLNFCYDQKALKYHFSATEMGKKISVAARRISSISDSVVSDTAVVITRRMSSLEPYLVTSTSNNMVPIQETPELPRPKRP